jgi:hypothetical protein
MSPATNQIWHKKVKTTIFVTKLFVFHRRKFQKLTPIALVSFVNAAPGLFYFESLNIYPKSKNFNFVCNDYTQTNSVVNLTLHIML